MTLREPTERESLESGRVSRDQAIFTVAYTLWRERPERQSWLSVDYFKSLAETVVADLYESVPLAVLFVCVTCPNLLMNLGELEECSGYDHEIETMDLHRSGDGRYSIHDVEQYMS